MDRLGVNSRGRDTNSPNFNSNQHANNRVSGISVNTYDNMDLRGTQQFSVDKDAQLPKEIARTTFQLNQGKMSEAEGSKDQDPKIRR